ncbi:hypothetical protein CGZ80_25075, partial [Rhodopirellula sp. MGV]
MGPEEDHSTPPQDDPQSPGTSKLLVPSGWGSVRWLGNQFELSQIDPDGFVATISLDGSTSEPLATLQRSSGSGKSRSAIVTTAAGSVVPIRFSVDQYQAGELLGRFDRSSEVIERSVATLLDQIRELQDASTTDLETAVDDVTEIAASVEEAVHRDEPVGQADVESESQTSVSEASSVEPKSSHSEIEYDLAEQLASLSTFVDTFRVGEVVSVTDALAVTDANFDSFHHSETSPVAHGLDADEDGEDVGRRSNEAEKNAAEAIAKEAVAEPEQVAEVEESPAVQEIPEVAPAATLSEPEPEVPAVEPTVEESEPVASAAVVESPVSEPAVEEAVAADVAAEPEQVAEVKESPAVQEVPEVAPAATLTEPEPEVPAVEVAAPVASAAVVEPPASEVAVEEAVAADVAAEPEQVAEVEDSPAVQEVPEVASAETLTEPEPEVPAANSLLVTLRDADRVNLSSAANCQLSSWVNREPLDARGRRERLTTPPKHTQH